MYLIKKIEELPVIHFDTALLEIMTNLYTCTFNQLKACIGSVNIIKYNEITINTCTKNVCNFIIIQH